MLLSAGRTITEQTSYPQGQQEQEESLVPAILCPASHITFPGVWRVAALRAKEQSLEQEAPCYSFAQSQ